MATRLDPVDLTELDVLIWAVVSRRFSPAASVRAIVETALQSDSVDATIMCKAGHWRGWDYITEPIWFRGPRLPWHIEQDEVRIHVGGAVGRYLP